MGADVYHVQYKFIQYVHHYSIQLCILSCIFRDYWQAASYCRNFEVFSVNF